MNVATRVCKHLLSQVKELTLTGLSTCYASPYKTPCKTLSLGSQLLMMLWSSKLCCPKYLVIASLAILEAIHVSTESTEAARSDDLTHISRG